MIIKLCERELDFDQSIVDYNEIRLKFVVYTRSVTNEFSVYYRENVWDFDTLYENGLKKYSQIVADSRKFISAVMQEYGLHEDISQMITDNSNMNNIIKFYAYNASELEKAVQMISNRRVARSGRSHYWEGGGFGLTGALKGAFTAGALNMGSDMLHGLGNTIGNASDHAKVRGIKNEIYKGTNHLEMLLTGLENLHKDLFNTAKNILIRRNILETPKLDFKKAAVVINEAKDMVQSITEHTSDMDYEKAIDLICQGLVYDPYNLAAYGILYIIPQTDKIEVQEFAKYFGMEDVYRAERGKAVKHIMDSISQIPEDTIPQIEEKMEEIKKIQEKYADICFDDNLLKLEEKKYKCIIDSISQIPENTILQIEEKIGVIKQFQEKYADIRFDDSLLKLEEKKRKIQQAEIEEAKQQAALAEAKKKAQIWEMRLDKDKDTAEPIISQIQNYLERNDIQAIWNLVNLKNIFAEYILEKYYKEAIVPAIDTVDAAQFNQVVSGIRVYAEQGMLFARYLLSYAHLLFWSEGYRDNEKVKKMLDNCAKAADCGCISAMVLISDWLDKGDTEFIPKVSKSRNEFIEIAAESQHPKAMWQYGKLCKDCAGNDLEKLAKAKYFLVMSDCYGYLPPKKENTSSGCFITSAVCRTFNKPDDCYELTTFRNFRDNWLRNQSDGSILIQEYYHIAPTIVEHIDRQANSEEIYQFIWDCYLAPCIQLIELQRFEQCKDRYIIMVNYLKEKFCDKTAECNGAFEDGEKTPIRVIQIPESPQ